ncbi:GNAT family N-acetyltransferase [Planococcus sp. ISL-109]|uniref:GNAT family N-acetyltransferase n=1 Tax=Planococcus sp. ISL-109 TaxID=2819166 RepID=UPI001BE91304|nr:GNAT family N-acetyltransferase [Planococcus sp. ISL-109]MBT2582624.1 GNAT family N-acetyltransferase [Planococcus sp. ISL-109]
MTNDYVFETERLGFRRWKPSDRVAFALMNANPDVMEFFPKTLTREESDELVDRIEDHIERTGYGLWAVEVKGNRTFIGLIGLLKVDFDAGFQGAIEIGWRLGKEHWHHGYATEGATACLVYGAGVLKLNEIYSFTLLTNTPSEAVMKRIGMKKVKEFDHPRVEDESPLKRHVLYKWEGK